MHMEEIESSLISHRGYDPERQILNIRFRSKTGVPGSLYQYGGVTPQIYQEGLTYVNPRTGEVSFGSWFGAVVKKDERRFPYRKLEDVGAVPVDPQGALPIETTDFASGQPIPATTAEPVEALPDDIEELKPKALALIEKAQAIVISDPVSYKLAEVTGVALARMRDQLEKTVRPKIKELYAPYKALLDIFNFFDKPMENHMNALRSGMSAFKRAEDAKAQRLANEERARLQKIADDEARERADALKLDDAIEAEKRGEPELAQTIMDSPALEVAAAYVPPVHVPSSVPRSSGTYHVENWAFVWVDAKGNEVQFPDLALIPKQYIIVDEKAIAAAVKKTKNRTDIAGIRVYDAGDVRFKKA